MTSRWVLWSVLPILLIASVAKAGRAGSWEIETVADSAGGRYASLQIDTLGNVHVSYFNYMEHQLEYSFWDHRLNKWFTTTVDDTLGGCSLVLDSRNRPHISYLAYGTGALKYAYFDGTNWKLQSIELEGKRISYYTSLVLDREEKPILSFYTEYSNAIADRLRLRVVSWTGEAWEMRTVDADEGSGKFNSLAMDATGHLQIAYGNVEYKNASLRYARWNGRAWEVEILEGAGRPGTSMWSVCIVLDSQSVPHLAYSDVANRVVKYGTKRGREWNLQAVDTVAEVGYPDRNGIALDSQGNPYISYYDAGAGVLKLAHQQGGKWIVEVVDRNFAGYTSSLRIREGTVWLAYADERSKRLKVAHKVLADVAQSGPVGIADKPDAVRREK